MEMKAPSDGHHHLSHEQLAGLDERQPFKVGDQVWPGAPLAKIPDLSTTLQWKARWTRWIAAASRWATKSACTSMRFPKQTLAAKLGSISPLTQQTFEWPPTRSFRAYAQIEKPDPRLRPGMNGSMDVVTSRIPDAISVPGKAIFTREGKPIVYVAQKDGIWHAWRSRCWRATRTRWRCGHSRQRRRGADRARSGRTSSDEHAGVTAHGNRCCPNLRRSSDCSCDSGCARRSLLVPLL